MDLYIGKLPVWKGVQNKPGFDTFPFIFTTNEGIIRLKLSENDIAQISENYGKDTYTFISSPPGTSNWGNHLGEFYFDFIKRWVGDLINKDVLEIGSGTLYIAERVISELHARSFYACDPAIHITVKNPRITVCKEYFSYDMISAQKKTFDFIISINNIEHISDLSQYLEDVNKLITPVKGRFFLILPDCTRALKTGDLGICVHEHLSYFTRESIEYLLQKHGFSIEKIQSFKDTLFVLVRSAHPLSLVTELNYDPIYESEKLLELFGSNFQNNLIFFNNLIMTRQTHGSIAIHGCCVALNNVLSLVPIENRNEVYLFDGDSNKTGKYLPTFDRPILSSGDNKYRCMNTVIIAALTYYSEILKEIQARHQLDRHCIFPMFP